MQRHLSRSHFPSTVRRVARESRLGLAMLSLCGIASAGVGQRSYDIDIGGGAAPSNGYAAAGAVGGVWNAIPASFVTSLLVDTSGASTGASITLSNALVAGGSAPTTYGPDDDALLSDFELVTLPNTWTLGLEPGEYDVIVHAFDPSDSSVLTHVTIVDATGVRFSDTCGGSSGPDAQPLVHGSTHVSTRVDVASSGPFANRIDVQVQGSGGPGRLNGIQIRPRPKAYFIDIGASAVTTPYLSYAAAAPYPGHWQTVAPVPLCFSMADIHGVLDGGVCPVGPTYFTGLAGALPGDDGKLMRDFQDVGAVGNSVRWEFLVEPGSYTVFVYSWSPDDPFATTLVTVSGSAGPQTCGGALWPGMHELGTTYTESQMTTTDGWINVDVETISGFGAVNGIQIIPRTSSFFTAFCNGDGSGTPCPCGNNNDGSSGVSGCANNFGAGGGKLEATGSNSIGAGDLVLMGSGLAPSQPGLYLQGLNAINGGAGNVFGDGIRCVGGGIIRLQVRTANASGLSNTTVNISTVGGVSPGDMRRYQLWYRDPAGPCGGGFNFTNGLEVSTWLP